MTETPEKRAHPLDQSNATELPPEEHRRLVAALLFGWPIATPATR